MCALPAGRYRQPVDLFTDRRCVESLLIFGHEHVVRFACGLDTRQRHLNAGGAVVAEGVSDRYSQRCDTVRTNQDIHVRCGDDDSPGCCHSHNVSRARRYASVLEGMLGRVRMRQAALLFIGLPVGEVFIHGGVDDVAESVDGHGGPGISEPAPEEVINRCGHASSQSVTARSTDRSADGQYGLSTSGKRRRHGASLTSHGTGSP